MKETTNQNSLDSELIKILEYNNVQLGINGTLLHDLKAWHHQQATQEFLALLPEKRKNVNPGTHYRACSPQQRENRGYNLAINEVTQAIKAREEQ